MTRPLQSILHVLVGGLAVSISGHSGVEGAASKGSAGGSCFEAGVAYSDESVTVSQPNGAHVESAGACKEACVRMPACRYFTYYAKERSRGARGSCWLLGPGSTSKPDHAALSGPKDCSDSMNGTDWVESLTDTVGGTLGATTGAVAAGHDAASHFPWWAWCLAALVVLAGGVGVAAGLGFAPPAITRRLKGKSRGSKIYLEEDEDEQDDEELAAAGAWALTSAPASTHSVPLPTYTTTSYSALPTGPPPLPMAQVTPRGSTLPRLSVIPQESFYMARAPPPGGLLSRQSFAGQPMTGVPHQQSVSAMPGQQSFAGVPHPQSFARAPQQQSFAGVPQQQSFSGNH